MNSQEFISKALKTECVPEVLSMHSQDLMNALRMAIYCANIMDQIKKYIIYGKDIDIVELSDNQSGLCWHSEALAKGVQQRENTVEMSIPLTNDDVNIRLLHAAIGVFTESGEMLEALLKQLITGELDKVNMMEESGDIDWYQAIAIDEAEIPEEQIRKTLIAKLAKRYPEKFTQEAALNRDLKTERETLEQGFERV